MKVFIIRHGETIENERKEIMGHSQGTLSSTGIKQVIKLSKYLKSIKFDLIYSSDLYRAVTSTQLIASYHENTPIIYLKELREMNFGDYTGKKVYEVDWSKIPNGGESYDDIYERITDFINKYIINNTSNNILIISHHLLINTFIAIFKKLPSSVVNTLDHQKACALNIFELNYDGQLQNVISLNETNYTSIIRSGETN